MSNFLVMTRWGWVGAINFSSPTAAIIGVKYFLNQEDDKVGRALDITHEADQYWKPGEVLSNLLRQGKAVDEGMISMPAEKTWDPTEFLRAPTHI
jgi:hypothetical protein